MSAYTVHLISLLGQLKYIFQKPIPIGKLAKWKILHSEFDIVFITQKAIKGQALAYRLTENPVDGDYETLTMYFLDEEVLFAGEHIAESYPRWRMFFNGAANFKGVGIGAVLISESGQHYAALAKIRFPCTNNMTEYEAFFLGIKMAVDMNVKEHLFIGDFELLIHKVQGEWSTKNVKILMYLHYVKELCKKFTKIKFEHMKSQMVNYGITTLEDSSQPENTRSMLLMTTMRTSAGVMPYMLVYGTEAVIPAELEIQSLRVIQEAKLDDVE
ncbi:uncharacterized protein [Nicotiana tomentosiformis]|uniref:uncharacterized protein n=1 Tax=Nicotiana tomentosiformis TaxID=4098 RepID=UPI00388CC756